MPNNNSKTNIRKLKQTTPLNNSVNEQFHRRPSRDNNVKWSFSKFCGESDAQGGICVREFAGEYNG